MRNPTKSALQRRKQVYQDGKILVSSFVGSVQQQDLDKTKGNIKGAVEDYFRVKSNIKPEPWQKYKESGDPKLLMFDFNWWPIPTLGTDDAKREPENWNNQFIYQLKGCNIACKFCFVDRYNNNGKLSHGAKYFKVSELVDNFLRVREEKASEGIRINVLRASGGEPSLVLEQWLQMLQHVEKRDLSDEVYVMSDTNLTTGSALESWMKNKEIDPGILKEIACYDNFGLLSCFKGTDSKNFVENTGCSPSYFPEQVASYLMFAEAGIRIYPHVINPDSDTFEGFMNSLEANLGEDIWKMMHIFTIGPYGPVAKRYGDQLEAQVAEWQKNYARGEEILDRNLKNRFGVGYKESSRPEVLEGMLSKL
ncbi:MAG: 4Fe-4S cluster-binding domain-containing protein [Nanoarchaeota archaeon]|nr:4Fe-4S cluster-binding domain-containing protein [Nanoarchaeota archaeon]MBU1643706.1 4Fe-4S cluster-binding domain-containing protein [Nanoarchaeota archaeon]MBU1977272.1 4Fe-4S cluster-binding domain-containing protein [Nanoarchaeota archaeon]